MAVAIVARKQVGLLKDALHNSCEAVVARIGMGYKAFFAANSPAIDKKNNAVDRPSPCCHSPQGVMQSILKALAEK